jgi:hypothetical protein
MSHPVAIRTSWDSMPIHCREVVHADVPVTIFGAKETTPTKINADLGKSDDPATKALFGFLGKALKE